MVALDIDIDIVGSLNGGLMNGDLVNGGLVNSGLVGVLGFDSIRGLLCSDCVICSIYSICSNSSRKA
jgi:hypothetical protein